MMHDCTQAADGEDLGTYAFISQEEALAQCNSDYSNRPSPLTCSRIGYGAFHIDYYCEALSGPNGAGEDLGMYHATSEGDCVSQVRHSVCIVMRPVEPELISHHDSHHYSALRSTRIELGTCAMLKAMTCYSVHFTAR
jgi:hypothetical protein